MGKVENIEDVEQVRRELRAYRYNLRLEMVHALLAVDWSYHHPFSPDRLATSIVSLADAILAELDRTEKENEAVSDV